MSALPKSVTKEHLESIIAKKEFFVLPGTTVTLCMLTLQNGFSVRGESACVDPNNFNKEIGEQIAFDNAFRQLWLLEGYVLKQKHYDASNEVELTFRDRLDLELTDLTGKCLRLREYLSTEQPASLEASQAHLLREQLTNMEGYHIILKKRIQLLEAADPKLGQCGCSLTFIPALASQPGSMRTDFAVVNDSCQG